MIPQGRLHIKDFLIIVPMPKAWHMLLIAAFFLIIQFACANASVANTGTNTATNTSNNACTISEINEANSQYSSCTFASSTFTSTSNQLEITPSPLEVNNTASRSIICPGDEVKYTIDVDNPGSSTVTNIVIKDSLDNNDVIGCEDIIDGTDIIDSKVELISVSPEPNKDGLWHISRLKHNECFTITLTIRVPNYDTKFNEVSEVSGIGYTSIHNRYGTTPQKDGAYTLKNCVHVSGDGIYDSSACADVIVMMNSGTELKKYDHGSGSYDSNDIADITNPESGSIQYSSSLHVKSNPVTLDLPGARTLKYASKWYDGIWTGITSTGASTTESFKYADSITKNNSVHVSWNATALKTDSEFNGMAHLGYVGRLRMDEHDRSIRFKPSFESSEDYAGNFSINGTFNTNGINAKSDRSVLGTGLVSNDKRIGNSQRIYEYGTGIYKSDELFKTTENPENHMVKDLQATYLPVSFSYRQGKMTNISTKWGEGTLDQVKDESSMSEEISNAEYLEKKITVQLPGDQKDWPGQLKSQENYSGMEQFKVTFADQDDQSNNFRLEEEQEGGYSIERKLNIINGHRTDTLHIYVRNDGRLVKDVTKNITIAKFSIIVINDGRTDLGPIYVKDVFPAGTQYISSTLIPSWIGPDNANWKIDYLDVGQSIKINLKLNLIAETNELVNRVNVSSWHNGRFIVAENFSTIEYSLPHHNNPLIHAYKIARVNPVDPSIIMYRIAVKNQNNGTIVARVTDFLPGRLKFLNSSVEHENDTYNTENNTHKLSWIMMNITPGTTRFVDFLAQSKSNGTFVNTAHIDAYAVDGSEPTSSDVNVSSNLSNITAGNQLPECNYPSEWKPPDWGFNCSCTECEDDLSTIYGI